jgi:predicted amidohydrolase YtcJ
MPEQKLSLEQALAAFTRTAAFAGFAEDRLGSLEPGHYADFIFLDRDIMAGATAQQIRDTRVLETWMNGERVWPLVSARAPSGSRR